MSNFICKDCGTEIIDSPDGYITECEHWPKERLQPLGPQYTTMIDLTEWHKNPKCRQVEMSPGVKKLLEPILKDKPDKPSGW